MISKCAVTKRGSSGHQQGTWKGTPEVVAVHCWAANDEYRLMNILLLEEHQQKQWGLNVLVPHVLIPHVSLPNVLVLHVRVP
jgi:hypothetical protein